MTSDSCVLFRRFTGIALWWMALAFGFFSVPSPLFWAVSFASFLGWLLAQILKRRLFYHFFELLYAAGIVAMVCISSPFHIVSASVCGAGIGLGFAIIAWFRARANFISTIQREQISALSLSPQYPRLFARFFIFFLAWTIGLIILIFRPGLWQHTIILAWTCAMIFIGYLHIWPFALHPEWLGYRMRRAVFVSKSRWIVRFVMASLLIVLAVMILISAT